MGKIGPVAALTLFFFPAAPQTLAADVTYLTQDGVTYRDTRHIIKRPVVTTHHEQRQQMIYRQKLRTDIRDTYRTYATPVTEYRCVTPPVGRQTAVQCAADAAARTERLGVIPGTAR